MCTPYTLKRGTHVPALTCCTYEVLFFKLTGRTGTSYYRSASINESSADFPPLHTLPPSTNACLVIQTALEVFVKDKRPRRTRKQHNGVQRSSKKKGSKGRAAYSLRGVNGEVATPP